MPIHNLERIFSPQSVAIVGASLREHSVGDSVLKSLAAAGGLRLFPVNPKYRTIGNLECWPKVEEIPETVDLAVICTPATTVPAVLRQCGRRGIRGIVILSAGFRETGQQGAELEAALKEEAAKWPGLRILGPNCLGFMVPHRHLNVSFVDQMPSAGNIAFVSQSGALCAAIIDWAIQEKVGFSHVISLGNMVDIGIADLLDYLATDPLTKAVVLYVESVTEARQFMSAARAFTRHKPIIVYKAGRFAESAKAASSHTGALAGVDSVYDAAFARAGIVRVDELDDLFDCAELLARRWTVQGARLAILTNAGGPGVMATDALMARRGVLASLSAETLSALDRCLPTTWPRANPVDVLGDATPQRYRDAISAVLNDPGVDSLLVLLTPQAMSDPTSTAQQVIEAAANSRKPVLTSWMGGPRVAEAVELLQQAGVPHYASPEKAVRAFLSLVSYAHRQEVLYETPREISIAFSPRRAQLRQEFATRCQTERGVLDEVTSKQILTAYDIPVSPTLIAHTAEEVVERCAEIGYPVVLKLFSPDITHKSDVGGVELNVLGDSQAIEAFHRIGERASLKRPDARIEGVTVQPMIVSPYGQELIVGAKRDPVFGMVMLVGAGGVTAELLQDKAIELPPLNERLARRMLESLRSWPLLQGYRGKPAVHIDRLIEVLIRLSYLVADYPEIESFDVNPLLATPDSVVALDARILLNCEALRPTPLPYSHLAIRPYPEEYTRWVKLKNGESVLLRPIRPEDEPLWHEFTRSCSAETLYRRFGSLFATTTHEMATRFCFIDYDRELAIVAEHDAPTQRKLLGVGRLVANADHTQAEFVELVTDAWQGTGLGSLLMDYCLEIARGWGVKCLTVETSPDNHRAIAMLQRRGFSSSFIPPNTIAFAKELVT
jgi:acetyltransferase